MAKAPITNRVKGKVWTDMMIIEFDGNIAGGVETCFRGLKLEQMEGVIEQMKKIFESRKANPSGLIGTNPTIVILDEARA